MATARRGRSALLGTLGTLGTLDTYSYNEIRVKPYDYKVYFNPSVLHFQLYTRYL